jgi:hypothetical protein
VHFLHYKNVLLPEQHVSSIYPQSQNLTTMPVVWFREDPVFGNTPQF